MSNEIATLTDEYCIKEYGWTKSQFEVVRNTYFKGMSVDDIKIFGHVCKHTGLDPFLKQIYPVLRQGKMTIQTAIDGYRLIAERTGKYSPGRESTFVYNKDGQPVSATAYVKKMTSDGTWHEVAATAYFAEYNPGVGPFWKKMPHTMIAKCAEALALRKAFPAELSAVRTSDEMDQADVDRLHPTECTITNVNQNESSPQLNNQNCDISTHNEPKLPLLSNEQVEILSKLYPEIDHVTKVNVDERLKKMNVSSWNDMPEKHFELFKTGMQNNINMMKKLSEEKELQHA